MIYLYVQSLKSTNIIQKIMQIVMQRNKCGMPKCETDICKMYIGNQIAPLPSIR